MKINCRFLIKYKDYDSLNMTVSFYKCILANALLTSTDLNAKWACGGCIIPQIMESKPCKYLVPHKSFPKRGYSYTSFSCKLLNVIMDTPAEFCNTKCAMYKNR